MFEGTPRKLSRSCWRFHEIVQGRDCVVWNKTWRWPISGTELFLELNSDLDIAPLHLGLASYVVPVLKSCEAYKVRA